MPAQIVWAGVSAVLVHNLLVLFSFVACGVAMYALVLELTRSRPAAWVAGAIYAFQPYRFGHYAQLELLWGSQPWLARPQRLTFPLESLPSLSWRALAACHISS